jgi:phosphoribosylformylglycinamidine synthase
MNVYDTFKYPKVDEKIAKSMGLKSEEFGLAQKILKRAPNFIELGIIASMWSEHCSYKSSKIHLKKLPTKGECVVVGPGENAGIIEIDEDICACFKIESHNHPSYIEPYNGAATGVGGILRDIFTMGARPVAAMNSLRFGKLDNDETIKILEGVVSGIAGYGNCFGVPTVGGEVFFDECYQKNPIVNAFALGLVKKDKIFLAKAEGVGNPIIYVGAKTGRDGIHGATMASEEFSSSSESKRVNVQIGDPFKEKLLLEACLEIMKNDYLVGIQDMGAAGLTSSSFEMASKSGSGVKLYLDKVPVREEGMTPYEIMLSESQERMLMVAKKGVEDKVIEIFKKWDLDIAIIGEVTDDGFVRLFWKDEEVASLPAEPLSSKAPEYNREYKKPKYIDEIKKFSESEIKEIDDLNTGLFNLLNSPTIASKRWIFEQYDYMVRTNTTVIPGSDAAVIRIKGSNKGIAMSCDCNPRYVYANPKIGAALSVVEAARNVAASGARPLAITNCLNFGNPEKPEIMWQFAEAVEGMKEACLGLNTPVVSGNVSFYNETEGKSIYPTPTVVMVGVIDDVKKCITSHFKNYLNTVIVIGEDRFEIGASEYLKTCHNLVKGDAPALDIEGEKNLIDFMVEAAKLSLVESAHDISEGGLAVALSEMTFENEIGCELEFDEDVRSDLLLFSESQGRMIIEVKKENVDKVVHLLKHYSLNYNIAGRTVGDFIVVKNRNKEVLNVNILAAKFVYENAITGKML